MRLTDEQIELLAGHAADAARLAAKQSNERVELNDRQAAERASKGLAPGGVVTEQQRSGAHMVPPPR